MEDRMFGSVFRGLKYGLLRMTAELKLIDFNSSAQMRLPLPRRGADLSRLIEGGAAASKLIGAEKGSIHTVAFTDGRKRINALGFREADGSILCLIHPFLSSAGLDSSNRSMMKIAKFYGRSIFDILEEADSQCGTGAFRVSAISDDLYFDKVNTEKYCNVITAVETVLYKLSNTNLNKLLKIVVGHLGQKKAQQVSLHVVQYAVTELISVFEMYGTGIGSMLYIDHNDKELRLVLSDSLGREPHKSDIYFMRIFTEMMKVLGVGCETTVNAEGRFFVKVCISSSYKKLDLNEDPYAEPWSYFDYCVRYFGYGEGENKTAPVVERFK